MSEETEQNTDNFSDREKSAEHRLRMRFGWDDLIEEMIQDGQERGAFENLRGTGKPLDLKSSQYAENWAIAHSIMKENKILPTWIEKRNQIVAEIELLRKEIAKKWTRYGQAFDLAQGKGHQDALALEWDGLCQDWNGRISKINKKISDFNLGRPAENLEIFRIGLDTELKRASARRHL